MTLTCYLNFLNSQSEQLGKEEGPRLASCITSARSSNKKSINAAWKLRMKDMPYDMVKWISTLHDKIELFEEDLKLLKEKVAALALCVEDHESRLTALENRGKDREDGRPAPSIHPQSTPQGTTRHEHRSSSGTRKASEASTISPYTYMTVDTASRTWCRRATTRSPTST